MHPSFREEIAILKPMFHQIDQVHPKADYLEMGQICIDKKYRKKGVFRNLYQHMVQGIHVDFDFLVTEIDAKNQRSLGAYLAIGFHNMLTYTTDGKNWILVALPT